MDKIDNIDMHRTIDKIDNSAGNNKNTNQIGKPGVLFISKQDENKSQNANAG